MKKTLLLGLLMLGGLTANAQLADGTEAPDFTAQDINGNTHSLQEYLDQGKTVVLYISATWCGPCWDFHNTHYLSDVYNTYGMGGSEEVVILYVEGDPSTTMADIQGTGTNTWGDWTAGTPYPILDNAQIADDYMITAFPTMYRICPETGETTEIARSTPYGLMQYIENGCQEVTGLPNWADINADDSEYCDATGTIRATVTNKTGDIESIKAKLFKDGTEIAEQTFTGFDLDPFEAATFGFDATDLDVEAEYHVELVEVNGAPAYEGVEGDLVSDGFEVSINDNEVTSHNNIKITVWTDYYPAEMSWAIMDSRGAVVVEGNFPDAALQGGGEFANEKFEFWHSLPAGSDCYSVALYDAYGDGWDLPETGSNERFGLQITSSGEVVYNHAGTGNWTLRSAESAFVTDGVMATNTIEDASFAIYPNPSEGVFSFATKETVSVTVLDITGKVVHTQKGISNGDTMNLNHIQSGVYIAKIKDGNAAERIEKLVIK